MRNQASNDGWIFVLSNVFFAFQTKCALAGRLQVLSIFASYSMQPFILSDKNLLDVKRFFPFWEKHSVCVYAFDVCRFCVPWNERKKEEEEEDDCL